VIYLRYPYPVFYYIWNFLTKDKKTKVITEHNTIIHEECKLLHLHTAYLMDLLFGNFLRGLSDGIVGVTEEITEYEVKRSGNPHKPHITIGNGIEVRSVTIRNPIDFAGEELDLLCVASVSRWHGLDRLLKGIYTYDGNTKVRLHIVGDSKEVEDLKKLATDYKLGDAVIFHGFLCGKPLDDMFNQCHIGVGSLGMHRKGLKMTSELKIREYTARGIPFLYGASDPDFPEDFPYLMKVPPDESAIDIKDVISFAKKVYVDPYHPMKMRGHAIENLDWSVKMKKLKNFCESLVNGDLDEKYV